MYRWVILVIFFTAMIACKPRKTNLASDEPVDMVDFIESFEPLQLPWTITDISLAQRLSDSFLINPSLMKQFVPDSVFGDDFKKSDKVRFHAIGRVSQEKGETYLFIKASTATKSVGYVLCYDQEPAFRTAMVLVSHPGLKGGSSEFSMDKRLTLTRTRSRRGADGQSVYRKDAYVYNTVGVFTLVLTESNEVVQTEEVYNPIDTLPRKHPLSGDYVINRNDFISIRDGRSDKRLLFFVHMTKDGGECQGELKGELDIVKPSLAQYNKADDHCVLEFAFSANALTLRELEACGNHRSVRCAFGGNYPKRKMPKKTRKK